MKKRSKKILVNIPVELKNIVKTSITVTSKTSILDARDLLFRYRISRLIVVSGKKPIGIITEKDVAKSISVFSKKPMVKFQLVMQCQKML